ncbi:pentapeptide repeat-containing protein [Nocardia sp. NRRL S-836]|uniref:pentapeptide repeat-containing protein n=1 Tax=Nocardia sp. NRRL S-836 TaxID=1519492 RepID=UPI0018D1710A|nr:pentapeptide repeat-containing protein [Nocardia sp. NRRL S-836]
MVDLRGTTFDEQLLNETFGLVLQYLPDEDAPALSWSLRKCVFTGHANFSAKVFGGFNHPQDDYVDLSDARFEADAVFTGTRFHGRVFFQHTRFDTASFDQVEFGHDAWFLGTRFNGTASFNNAAFTGSAYFHDVAASSAVVLTGATFSGSAHLDPITTPSLDLAQAEFVKRATVHIAGSCIADHARFDDGVAVRLLHCSALVSTLSLTGVRLGAPSTVTGDIPHVDHGTAVSTATAAGRGADLPRLLSLADADVADLTVTDVDLGRCLFTGAINLDQLRMGGTVAFARPERHRLARWQPRTPRWWQALWRWCSRGDRPVGREMLLDELVARLGPTEALGTDRDPRGPASRRATDDQVAVLYRALRKAREDAKDEPGAGDFYYGEMEARRRGARKRGTQTIIERLVLTLYRVLSGYGLRAGRALAWLLALVTVLTVLLMTFGLPDTTGPAQRMTGTLQPAHAADAPRELVVEVRTPPILLPPPDRLWTLDRAERAARVALGSVVFRDTDQQLTTAGRWTVNSGRLLGPLLIALAALAIRARVKR